MNNTIIHRIFFTGLLTVVLPGMVLAKKSINDPGKVLINKLETVAVTDSIPSSKKPTEKSGQNKPDDIIKEVPKARPKLKPGEVVIPIKVKPIKVIKPKIKVNLGL